MCPSNVKMHVINYVTTARNPAKFLQPPRESESGVQGPKITRKATSNNLEVESRQN